MYLLLSLKLTYAASEIKEKKITASDLHIEFKKIEWDKSLEESNVVEYQIYELQLEFYEIYKNYRKSNPPFEISSKDDTLIFSKSLINSPNCDFSDLLGRCDKLQEKYKELKDIKTPEKEVSQHYSRTLSRNKELDNLIQSNEHSLIIDSDIEDHIKILKKMGQEKINNALTSHQKKLQIIHDNLERLKEQITSLIDSYPIDDPEKESFKNLLLEIDDLKFKDYSELKK